MGSQERLSLSLGPTYLPSALFKSQLGHLTSPSGFPGGSVIKKPSANAGDICLIPGRSPGGGNGNPLQYSCLGNSMDRGALWAVVYGVAKEWDTAEQLIKQITPSPSSKPLSPGPAKPH